MTETRIPPLPRDQWTDEAREVFAFWGEPNAWEEGSKTSILPVMGHHPALGMAYNDKKDYGKAIEEFTAAIEADKNLHKAKFQRGMAYVRTKEWTKAKSDLEQFQKNAKDDFLKGTAQKALMDIMAAQN